MNKYSVPARLVGRQVRVLLHASDLAVYDGTTEVARHERLLTRLGPPKVVSHQTNIQPALGPGAVSELTNKRCRTKPP